MSVNKIKDCFTREGFECIFDAPMDKFTTLKIGGKADVMVMPASVDELKKIISLTRENDVPVCFMGNGSNLLVSDKGIRGVVVRLGSNMASTRVSGNEIYAESGISLSRLATVACEHSLTGFEFASGIPGTLGGGIIMNAGAYKGELKDVVEEVTALLPGGETKTFSADELDFSYRHSVFTDSDMIVLSAKIRLEKGDREEIGAKINELNKKRRTTQPLEYPSAGSAFKRPANGYAAAMIDACGLKGFAVGGAQVSEKHAGFVINRGGATAEDMLALLAYVRQTVKEKCDTLLEPEIVIIGEK